MNQEKTKEEFILELMELKQEHDSLKAIYEKSVGHKQVYEVLRRYNKFISLWFNRH